MSSEPGSLSPTGAAQRSARALVLEARYQARWNSPRRRQQCGAAAMEAADRQRWNSQLANIRALSKRTYLRAHSAPRLRASTPPKRLQQRPVMAGRPTASRQTIIHRDRGGSNSFTEINSVLEQLQRSHSHNESLRAMHEIWNDSAGRHLRRRYNMRTPPRQRRLLAEAANGGADCLVAAAADDLRWRPGSTLRRSAPSDGIYATRQTHKRESWLSVSSIPQGQEGVLVRRCAPLLPTQQPLPLSVGIASDFGRRTQPCADVYLGKHF